MTNHRKIERIKAMTFTTVRDYHEGILLGFLGDLTLQGAMVVGEKLIEPDRSITLRIEFRESKDIPRTVLTIPAHVAWSRAQDAIYFNTGLQFLEVSAQNRNTIDAILDKYKFDQDLVL